MTGYILRAPEEKGKKHCFGALGGAKWRAWRLAKLLCALSMATQPPITLSHSVMGYQKHLSIASQYARECCAKLEAPIAFEPAGASWLAYARKCWATRGEGSPARACCAECLARKSSKHRQRAKRGERAKPAIILSYSA